MASSRRPRSRPQSTDGAGAAGLALLAILAAACSAAAPAADTARTWGEGPARWLLLPDEQEELRAVRTSAELSRFLQEFWARRDDDPTTAEVPLGTLFAERVSAADRLYPEGDLRGSLTDRGRVLVLLGPPSILRTAQQRAPTWSGSNPPPGARPTRLVTLEIWAYRPEDLAPELRELMGLDWENREIAVTFHAGQRHTRLTEGKELLELAARALVREPARGH
jgi:GWxTD domain-containing protein